MNSAQCYVAAWMGGEFWAEWIHVYVLLSPSGIYLTRSQHCTVIAILQYRLTRLKKNLVCHQKLHARAWRRHHRNQGQTFQAQLSLGTTVHICPHAGLYVKGLCYFLLPPEGNSLPTAPLRKLQTSPSLTASQTLPSACVSVLPSSSHKGASCSGVERKENRCRTMGHVWSMAIISLVWPPGYLHTHILETKPDERSVVSERQTTREKPVLCSFQ